MAIRVKKITQEELDVILEQHKLWLETDCKQGKRADLSWADLSHMDLSYKDLSYAILTGADLSYANLYRADLICADLSYAILTGADITDANLAYANLTSNDFTNIAYSEITAFFALACPEKGSFIGFKKVNSIFRGELIVELLIPDDAKRSSATTRKCRCSKAKVLSITNLDGTDAGIEEVSSDFDHSFIYKVGETVEVEDFNDDRWKECTSGIHFFITRDEAVRYGF